MSPNITRNMAKHFFWGMEGKKGRGREEDRHKGFGQLLELMKQWKRLWEESRGQE